MVDLAGENISRKALKGHKRTLFGWGTLRETTKQLYDTRTNDISYLNPRFDYYLPNGISIY